MQIPTVTVIAPCRNEANFIEDFVADLQRQDYEKGKIFFGILPFSLVTVGFKILFSSKLIKSSIIL